MRFFFLLMTILCVSCAQNPADAQGKLTPEAFENMLNSDTSVQLVDVRTPQEFESGHIAGARLIDFQGADFAQKIGQLDKTRPVMVYCAVGGRSAAAAKQCSKLGFTKVYDLKGGITAWKEKGMAVEK